MGYGNINKMTFVEGNLTDVVYTLKEKAERINQSMPLDRLQAAERAQKKRAKKELDQFIKDAQKGDFLEFE